MLSQLVLGRAMTRVARIDLASVAADRCARRGRYMRWLRSCLNFRARLERGAAGFRRAALAQQPVMRNQP